MGPELLVAGGTFVAVALLAGLAAYSMVVGRVSPERRRLERMAAGLGRGTTGVLIETPPDTLVRGERTSLESRLEKLVPKSPKDMSRLQRQLAMAGYDGYLPAAIYALAEMALPVVFALTTLAVIGWPQGLVFALILGAVGFILPGLYLSRLIRDYKKMIRNGLADALDLLIVCVEAGLGLDQALMKTAEELSVSYPQLAAELATINTEIRAGKPRLEAFRNFAERTKVDDVESLVSMMVQTDRFGTSIAQGLRTHADVLRTKRRQRAEEKAAKLGVKLVFPLVLCLFPALYVVTLGPAVIQFVRVFYGGLVAQ
jgi:tight adherence protein C